MQLTCFYPASDQLYVFVCVYQIPRLFDRYQNFDSSPAVSVLRRLCQPLGIWSRQCCYVDIQTSGQRVFPPGDKGAWWVTVSQHGRGPFPAEDKTLGCKSFFICEAEGQKLKLSGVMEGDLIKTWLKCTNWRLLLRTAPHPLLWQNKDTLIVFVFML